MLKNKYLFFLLSISLSIILFIFGSVNKAFANPAIASFLLNGGTQSVTFNPNNGESVSIEVKANTQVKFTRLYICSVNQICNGTSGNYTRYFSQSDISDTISKSWNGKKSGDTEIVSSGEYKVMASMTEGTNDPVTEFGTYSIFVDFSSTNSTTTNSTSSSTSNANNTSTTTNSSTSSSNVPSTRIVYVSTHSGTEDLSNYDEKKVFETTAGRERMAIVGSPIEFDAKYTLLQKDQCSPTFRWSFGDGFESTGKNVTHTYKYSGEYQVVLNGECGEYSSVSRTITKVISPEVSISSLINGDTKISNDGKTEINIGNWKINGGQKDFIFPQDTIIGAGKNIILSNEDLIISSSSKKISLNNPMNREVTYFNIKNTEQSNVISLETSEAVKTATSTTESEISIIEAERLANEYKEKIALNEKEINNIENTKETAINEEINDDVTDGNNDIAQAASVLESVNSTSTEGFWTKLFNIPVKSIKSFAHIFYDF